MTLLRDLIGLGFKENDAAVYVAVLERGEPGIGDLEKATGLHKQLIYLSAERLEREGLLSIHEIRGRRHFSIPNPAALEEQAKRRLGEAQHVVPRLFEIASKKRAAEDVRVYRSAKGVQHYYQECIRMQPARSTVSILGVESGRFFEIFPKHEGVFDSIEQTRIKRGITWKLLLFGEARKEAMLNRGRPLVQLRLLDDVIRAPSDVIIWHDRVGLLFYGEEPYVLDLSGPTTVEGFRSYFDVLWKRAKTVRLSTGEVR